MQRGGCGDPLALKHTWRRSGRGRLSCPQQEIHSRCRIARESVVRGEKGQTKGSLAKTSKGGQQRPPAKDSLASFTGDNERSHEQRGWGGEAERLLRSEGQVGRAWWAGRSFRSDETAGTRDDCCDHAWSVPKRLSLPVGAATAATMPGASKVLLAALSKLNGTWSALKRHDSG